MLTIDIVDYGTKSIVMFVNVIRICNPNDLNQNDTIVRCLKDFNSLALAIIKNPCLNLCIVIRNTGTVSFSQNRDFMKKFLQDEAGFDKIQSNQVRFMYERIQCDNGELVEYMGNPKYLWDPRMISYIMNMDSKAILLIYDHSMDGTCIDETELPVMYGKTILDLVLNCIVINTFKFGIMYILPDFEKMDSEALKICISYEMEPCISYERKFKLIFNKKLESVLEEMLHEFKVVSLICKLSANVDYNETICELKARVKFEIDYGIIFSYRFFEKIFQKLDDQNNRTWMK